jgi:HlyD family secretion protein
MMNGDDKNRVSRSFGHGIALPSVVPALAAAILRRWRVANGWAISSVMIALLVAVAGSSGWWISRQKAIAQSGAVPPARAAVRTVTATGTVNPLLTTMVGSQISGAIQNLYCDYNTKVKRGQICATIDPRPFQAVVERHKADLAVAKAQLEKDQASLWYDKVSAERNANLASTKAVSQDAADRARSVYQQAQAQVMLDQATIEQIQAEIDTARLNLQYTDIISPVAGTVVSRNVAPGQTVGATYQAPALFLIATDLTKMQVDASIREGDIGGLKEGNRATITVDAFPRRTFEGVVAQIRQSSQSVQSVVMFDVVVRVDNSDLALKPGMTAATRIVADADRRAAYE